MSVTPFQLDTRVLLSARRSCTLPHPIMALAIIPDKTPASLAPHFLGNSTPLSLPPSRMCAECPLCDTGCINFSHISVPFPSPWQSEAVALSVFLRRETLSSSHLRQVLEPSFLETPVLPSTCCGCFHFRPLYPALHSRLPFFSLHLRLHLSFVSLAENQVFPSVISALRGVQVD